MMTRHNSARVAVAVAAGLATVMLTGPARPAQAYVAGTPPCYGATCVGQDPNITNREGVSCASTAVDLTPVQYVAADADVAVRWSAWCGANWVRWESSDASPGQDQFYIKSADGLKQYNGPAYSYYTPMANGTETVMGCAVFPGSIACVGPF